MQKQKHGEMNKYANCNAKPWKKIEQKQAQWLSTNIKGKNKTSRSSYISIKQLLLYGKLVEVDWMEGICIHSIWSRPISNYKIYP